MREALALVLAYLLGSIPSGHIAGRLRGVDLRTVGSGNMGAANVFRTLGKKMGIAVLVADIAKGVVAVVVAAALTDDPWPLVAGVVAVAGHIFPVWLRFRGGKGVATAAGVVVGLMPLVAAVVLPAWLLIVALTRYTSVGSITAAAAATPLAWAFGYDWPYIALAGVMAVAILVKHRSNIQRLIRGNENRIQLRRPKTA
jgi:acyl phosphate:glycerol-3-phosphate acyltransferase